MDGPLVMVKWVDAYGCASEWRDIKTLQNDVPLVCRSVGWLFDPGDDADFVTIIPHMTTNEPENVEPQGCGDMTIPKRAIITTTILAPAVVGKGP